MNQEKTEKKLLDHETSLPIAEIRTRLAPMNLRAVAIGSDVHVDSVYRLANGEGDPKATTLLKVSRFLRAHAAGEDVMPAPAKESEGSDEVAGG